MMMMIKNNVVKGISPQAVCCMVISQREIYTIHANRRPLGQFSANLLPYLFLSFDPYS